jgi:NOL1/NOP2/sun family putative RNA methylase
MDKNLIDQRALPEEFLERLQGILPPPRYPDCVSTFYQEAATAFRVNVLKDKAAALEEELRAAGFELEPLAWKRDAFVVPNQQRRALTETAACREGRLYIQNPSSMIPPLMLDPQPGEWILDMGAAPGSKTLQMAGMMANQGKISAVESVRGRFFRLRDNLEKHGATQVQTYLKDGIKVWRNCPEQFDRVLLDAACSAEGRFNVHEPSSYGYWSTQKIREMQRKQKRLLFSAVQCLKPGGTLVYSTCTFAPEENEVVVDSVLKKFGEALRLEEVERPSIEVQAGLTCWRDKALHPDLHRALRILPDGVMEGFFVCRLRKLESTLKEDFSRGGSSVKSW